MAETLTESFCERCGTRYEFKAPTRLNPLRKTRGFIGGLRNYLTSQDALSDAMGDAMRSEESTLASAQLDAFHESFNFCIDCRQYTCVNCWNDAAGRCRSCAPIAGTDDLAERLAASAVAAPMLAEAEPVPAADEVQRRPGFDAWPTSDRVTDAAPATNGHVGDPRPTAEESPVEMKPVVAEVEEEPLPEPRFTEEVAEPAPQPVVAFDAEPEPVIAFEPEPPMAFEPEPLWPESQPLWPESEPSEPVLAEIEPELIAAELEPDPEALRPPLRVVAWDEDSAYELIEPEPVAAEVVEPEPEPVVAEVEPVAAEAVEPEPEPVAAEAVEPEPEPVAAEAVEPEPVVAEVEPEPEPVARPITAISDTILRFPTRADPARPAEHDRAAATADSPEVAARRAQLDLLGLGDPGQGPLTPERPPAMPYRSRGAGVTQSEIARQAALKGSFWEASAREVAGAAGQVGIQSCGQCGLSLSANARFCRRCGTRQAQSA